MTSTSGPDAAYFATSGPTTDLERHGALVEALPADPAALGAIARGLLLHDWTAMMQGITLSPERNGMKTFGAAPVIDRILGLDPAPLGQERPAEERLIGFCYHFAVVHCALLRAKGVPSRTRCGFANYLMPDKWSDHWVVEYWDGDQWRLNDPQIGLDELSHDDFHDGVRAWEFCRTGEGDPASHGNGELWGWDELRGSLVNDLGALCKIEVGDWDWCAALQVDPLDQPHPALDAELDTMAELATPGQPLDQLHAAFQNTASFRPPDELW